MESDVAEIIAGERIAGVFELFSIGIGPSSSHTVGPMRAAREFALELASAWPGEAPDALTVDVYGSLAATGRGHNTFAAVLLGLEGAEPETLDPDAGRSRVAEIEAGSPLRLLGAPTAALAFTTADIAKHPLAVRGRYANEIAFTARRGTTTLAATFYSIGGGFIVRDAAPAGGPGGASGSPTPVGTSGGADVTEVRADAAGESRENVAKTDGIGREATLSRDSLSRDSLSRDSLTGARVGAGGVPFGFVSGAGLLEATAASGLSVAEVVLANECVERSPAEVRRRLHEIWRVMRECIEAGLTTEGILPGGLKVPRRAARLAANLAEEGTAAGPEWATIAAMAVNEENAAGNRVVTAPTNGAAGIVPAVLYHALRQRYGTPRAIAALAAERTDPGETRAAGDGFESEAALRDVETYLLTAAAVGGIIKHRASISGADVGCQGEVGSASAMAAAGLAALLGATPAQVENAAEVAMEHHLGLTCDPIGGLVQIPCIERNGVAAVTAITAARLALGGDGAHHVSFDQVVETMRQTGLDMSDKYRETSRGGLAVNVPEC